MPFSFLNNIRSEFLKIKDSAALGLTLLAALFIPGINTLICVNKPGPMMPKFLIDPWLVFIRLNYKNIVIMILPLFIILITNLVLQIEFKNATWKQVYATPRKYADIFYTKFIVIQVLVISFMLLVDIFIIASGVTIHTIEHGYEFLFITFPWRILFIQTFRTYVGVLGVCAIQYWLSTRFRNFIIPLGVGIGLWITGLVLMDWDKCIYYPYMYSTFLFVTDFSKRPSDLPILITCSFIAFATSIMLGFWNIYSLKRRG